MMDAEDALDFEYLIAQMTATALRTVFDFDCTVANSQVTVKGRAGTQVNINVEIARD